VAGDGATPRTDFFVSYDDADRSWAEWIAWHLEDAGYRVVVQAWDFGPGAHTVAETDAAVQNADQMVAVLSGAYLESATTRAEWQATWQRDPNGQQRRLIVLRIEDCTQPGLLGQLVTVDLFGLDRGSAKRRLLAAARRERGKPVAEPTFPGGHAVRTRTSGSEPAFPGRLPSVWNLPPRLITFAGRQELLQRIHREWHDAGATGARIQALYGLGGVGKTQTTIEYAWRYSAEYDLIWWIDAGQPARIREQIANLVAPLGLRTTTTIAADAAAALDWLRRSARWLLIFDNARAVTDLRNFLPDGAGHVLVTSQSPVWGTVAGRIHVEPLERSDTISLLRRRIGLIETETADELADRLGDLPLAVEQAAAYLEATNLSPPEYLERLRSRLEQFLPRGEDYAYGGTVDSVWSLALEQLEEKAPDAVQLLRLCAHLGPEPIPIPLISEHPELLDPPLREIVSGTHQTKDLDDTFGAILGYSLARRNGDTIQFHRLVQAAIRRRLSVAQRNTASATARALLVAHEPREGDNEDPRRWPRWATLLPQVLTAPALHPDDHAVDIGHDARWLLLRASWHLADRGDVVAAHGLSVTLRERWKESLGDDHPDTLSAVYGITQALRALRRADEAKEWDEDTLMRRRRMFGDDHPDTLASASNLAADLRELGDAATARILDENTLSRRRRLIGVDHRFTLRTANNLALDLHELGEISAARALNEDTLRRRRRVLGSNHPHTLISAGNLARDLSELGDHAGARLLNEDTLGRRRRVLGEHHPHTLTTVHNLLANLRGLGEVPAAHTLDQETRAVRREVLGVDLPETIGIANPGGCSASIALLDEATDADPPTPPSA
jgi:hypothetical protein